ncbi:MAG: hypothetical protein LBU67_02110 [Oscillospiraceae bacterium]|nr:hypothetical protein [Oscillospiraceae bacterium]
MNNLVIVCDTLLEICGALALIAGAGRAVLGLFKPFRALSSRVDGHERGLQSVQQRLTRLEADTKAGLRASLALLDRAVSGNFVEACRSARDALQRHLAAGGR